jgi:hypothetical protein
MPRVYNKHHKDVPTDAVYVGRPTGWGNPFSHLPSTTARFRVASRDEAIEKYREWVLHPDRAILYYKIREELAGKDLVCWCAPKACHADIMLEIANAGE